MFFYLIFPSVFFNHYRFWLPFCIFKLLLTPSSKSYIDKHSLINQINVLLNRVKIKDGILHVFNGILCDVNVILKPFPSVALHTSGTRNLLLRPWQKCIWPPLLVLKITQLQDRKYMNNTCNIYHHRDIWYMLKGIVRTELEQVIPL